MCNGLRHEQERVFSYKSHEFIRDRETGLWLVAYTERVMRACGGMLFAAYG